MKKVNIEILNMEKKAKSVSEQATPTGVDSGFVLFGSEVRRLQREKCGNVKKQLEMAMHSGKICFIKQ